MFYSKWTFICETKNEKNTKMVMNRIFEQLGESAIDSSCEKYSKSDFDGFKVSVKFEHQINDWNELIVTLIGLGQCLDNGWYLTGDIFETPTAILAKENSHIKIVGLYWASWEIDKNE